MSTPVMTCVFTCPHASPFLLKERTIDTCQGAVLGGSGILMAIGASSVFKGAESGGLGSCCSVSSSFLVGALGQVWRPWADFGHPH